jgi:beta-mannanase
VTVTVTPKPSTTPRPSTTPTASATPTPTPTPTPTVAAAPPLAALTAPTDRYFGLYTEQAPFSWSTYDDASTKLATTPQTVGYFSGWDEAFRANAVTRAWAKHTLPIMTWESRPIDAANNVVDEPDYSLSRIIDGDFDDYLRTYAKAVVATGLPLGIRLDHEMNGTWYPWAEDDGHGNSINGNSAGQYVQMWRHVHDIFQEEGANQYVFWIWSPNRINKLTASHRTQAYLDSLYPGDDYVDWVGMSGYLRPAYAADDDFTFDYTFGSTLKQLRTLAPSKRILLAEIGASESGGHKVKWIQSMFDALAKPENDDIVGMLWFDEAVSTYTEGVLGTNDWRVDSRPETLTAFQAGLARTDTGFGPLPSP